MSYSWNRKKNRAPGIGRSSPLSEKQKRKKKLGSFEETQQQHTSTRSIISAERTFSILSLRFLFIYCSGCWHWHDFWSKTWINGRRKNGPTVPVLSSLCPPHTNEQKKIGKKDRKKNTFQTLNVSIWYFTYSISRPRYRFEGRPSHYIGFFFIPKMYITL